jgi:DNA-binding NtrC family response regulator
MVSGFAANICESNKSPIASSNPEVIASIISPHDRNLLENAEGCDSVMAIILIVEDEVFIRQAAEWAIEDLGHTPLMAEDLASALVHLSAPGSIDMLFVDIRLNALASGGYDVANQALDLRPDLRVLYTSGRPLTADMSDQFVAGGQFIQKPYSPGQLEVSVDKLLH